MSGAAATHNAVEQGGRVVIKGPMKQHHQRVLRLWQCPECQKTLRLPGRVTSRVCRCSGDDVMMQLQHTDRIRKFDVDEFVSYQTEEDLTPTEAELVEEIPEHLMPIGPSEEELAAKAAKPRRGKAYLRAEIDEDAVSTKPEGKDEPTEEFGAGLDDEPLETIPVDRQSNASREAINTAKPGSDQSPENDSEDTTGTPGRKRRRRRRRRGRGPDRDRDASNTDRDQSTDSKGASSETNGLATSPKPSQDATSSSEKDSSSSPSSDDSAKTGRKRRRRRRRRGKGSPGPDSSGD